ncbi:DNA-(apurinic or apyrimidinic site) lyase [Ferroglobus placidus DSM 10642]|uniref:8-oxoguanine DNA glycosylase/AP lyase n=1 Tax=Ferroglobus placidus (strain DSM 10642 / AEDII12DO) TaxID=589924 RepID=D3RZL6_FERPA|nr:DNA-(apurinic or apyrimidinic site) lyase [Ferroglobus placidus DSM 10642]
MNSLILKINSLKREISPIVEKRIEEFLEVRRSDSKRWFSELCFCILTANSSAELGIKIQKELGEDGFLNMSLEELKEKLRSFGHRFYSKRAEYIVEARKYAEALKKIVTTLGEFSAREWLVKNVKGIGYKEASHFLRNVGYFNLAILDRHILSVLSEHGIIEKPKTLTRRRYLEIEERMRELAEKVDLSLGELDLYLWYMKTGKVLK